MFYIMTKINDSLALDNDVEEKFLSGKILYPLGVST